MSNTRCLAEASRAKHLPKHLRDPRSRRICSRASLVGGEELKKRGRACAGLAPGQQSCATPARRSVLKPLQLTGTLYKAFEKAGRHQGHHPKNWPTAARRLVALAPQRRHCIQLFSLSLSLRRTHEREAGNGVLAEERRGE